MVQDVAGISTVLFSTVLACHQEMHLTMRHLPVSAGTCIADLMAYVFQVLPKENFTFPKMSHFSHWIVWLII